MSDEPGLVSIVTPGEVGHETRRDAASVSGAAAEEDRPARITIAVVTYRRPVGLARLLEALGRLEFTQVQAPLCRVLVVDNEPQGSAAAVCQREKERLPWPLAYVHEPRRGISQARNAAVRHGLAEADWLAFIDDDEIPEPCWLDELLYAQNRYAADVVGGPVVPMFQEPPARWIIKGDFFAPLRYATGTRLDRAYTGNVLVSARVFREMPDPFDERFGLSGGEDVDFFRRVAGRGYRLVWADKALAHEWVPASRVTTGWLLRRAYRLGNNSGVSDRDLGTSAGTIARHTGTAIARIAKGLLLVLPSVFLGRHIAMKAARTAALGAGYLAGVLRLRYHEYRTMHGG
jgi:succinoglycan biosynthesis protein ExoM